MARDRSCGFAMTIHRVKPLKHGSQEGATAASVADCRVGCCHTFVAGPSGGVHAKVPCFDSTEESKQGEEVATKEDLGGIQCIID